MVHNFSVFYDFYQLRINDLTVPIIDYSDENIIRLINNYVKYQLGGKTSDKSVDGPMKLTVTSKELKWYLLQKIHHMNGCKLSCHFDQIFQYVFMILDNEDVVPSDLIGNEVIIIRDKDISKDSHEFFEEFVLPEDITNKLLYNIPKYIGEYTFLYNPENCYCFLLRDLLKYYFKETQFMDLKIIDIYVQKECHINPLHHQQVYLPRDFHIDINCYAVIHQ